MSSSSIFFITFSALCLAMSTARDEEPIVIDGGAWPEQKEQVFTAHHLHRNVAELGSVLFAGNVLRPLGGGAEQWIVAFCPSWWEPCQHLDLAFSEAAASWQARLNTDDFKAKIRFARVDCATDKVLCNEQGVETYPTIAHYREGRQIRQTGLNPKKMKDKLEGWLHSSLVEKAEEDSVSASRETTQSNAASGVDLALVVLALLASFRLVSASPDVLHGSTVKKAANCVGLPSARQPDPGRVNLLPEEWASTRSSVEL
eukprot:gb/GFBE01024285.1/.p1 GENE.gb/GFBE01024285.1/~~gb/GFBE01024285.1/.p1  ORF type:complete len:258 (+),score=54.32 gb/GFBE01024285.1/:1-774(+)